MLSVLIFMLTYCSRGRSHYKQVHITVLIIRLVYGIG